MTARRNRAKAKSLRCHLFVLWPFLKMFTNYNISMSFFLPRPFYPQTLTPCVEDKTQCLVEFDSSSMFANILTV